MPEGQSKTDEILNKVMDHVESWGETAINSISTSNQMIAFHLCCLTEERIRTYNLVGIAQNISQLHMKVREDLFTLEWSLRCLQKLPDETNTSELEIRKKWNDKVAEQCMNNLEEFSKYYMLRDLVICTKRRGYSVSCPDHNTIEFVDAPNWQGHKDQKSRYISQLIEEDNSFRERVTRINDFSLEGTLLDEKFPHDLDTSEFSSNEFWKVWNYLSNLCARSIANHYKPRKKGRHYHTKMLTIIKSKKALVSEIYQRTGIGKSVVSRVISWLSFNTNTPRKFSLFHCPIIEINNKSYLILPHAVVFASPSTVFLRLLAHYDKRAYDSASSMLEKNKLNKIKSHLISGDRPIKTGIKLDLDGRDVELDLAEYDKNSSILSIVQAKFFIPPDTVSEVDSANEVILEAVEQLKINKKLAESNEKLDVLFQKIGISSNKNIEIKYFLLPTGFTGSDYLDIPDWIHVIPAEFCLLSKYKGQSLVSIWQEYKKIWNSLDESAKSSYVERNSFNLAGWKFVAPTFRM